MAPPESHPRILVRLDADLERRIVRAMTLAWWIGVLAGGGAALLAEWLWHWFWC